MKMLMNGEWTDRDNKINVTNPYNGEIIDTVPAATAQDMKDAIASAVEGFKEMKALPVHRRIAILRGAADRISANHEAFARIIATEASKTIREARKEVTRCVNTMEISAEESRRLLGETIPFDSMPGSENRLGYYYRFPIGIIGAITPFNDPLNLVAHKLGPGIAGGNALVLKPATVTPLSALKLAEALLEAGLPPKGLSVVTGFGDQIGDALVTDPRIRMITFTGGTEAGQEIVRKAGLKKIAMELGSNSPTIVMDDCKLDNAVELCVSGAFWAVGQNCIGVQRLLVHEPILEAFTARFVEKTARLKVGCQLNEDTDMGPMITEKEAARVEAWIEEAVSKGAKVLTGGKRKGTLVEPTVLTHVPEGVKVDCEEVFGPVVSIYGVRSLEQAIEKANNVPYGLHAAIFTQDMNRAFQAVKELDCGGVMVNDSTDYRVDQMPFGGTKMSGLGREGIKFSLMEMTEPKVVCFNL